MCGSWECRADKVSLLEIGDDVAVEDVIHCRQNFGRGELPLGFRFAFLIYRSCFLLIMFNPIHL